MIKRQFLFGWIGRGGGVDRKCLNSIRKVLMDLPDSLVSCFKVRLSKTHFLNQDICRAIDLLLLVGMKLCLQSLQKYLCLRFLKPHLIVLRWAQFEHFF